MLEKYNLKKLSLYSLFLFPILPSALQSISVGLFILLSSFSIRSVLFNKKNIKLFIVLAGYYIWQLLSILWSDNKNVWNEIQPTIMLLLIPLIISFSSFEVDENDRRISFNVFIKSLLFYLIPFYKYLKGGLILYQERIPDATNKIIHLPLLKNLGLIETIKVLALDFINTKHGLYNIAKEAYNYFGEPEFFTHYNYVSPCFVMGSFICLYLLNKVNKTIYKIGYLTFSLLFFVIVFYSSAMISKVLLLTIIPIFLIQIYIKKKIWAYLVLLFFVFSVFGLNKNTIIEKLGKIEVVEKIYDPAERKTVLIDYIRLHLYKVSIELISEHFLLGVGIGDVKVEVNKRLPNTFINGIGELGLKNPLNTHSQFLNYFVSGGIINIILFLVLIVFLLLDSIKKKNGLYLIWLVIIISSCLFENYLSRLWGVLFFCNFILLFIYPNQLKSENG